MKRKQLLLFIFAFLLAFLFLLKPRPVLAALGFTELGSVVDSETITTSYFGLGIQLGDVNGDGYQDLLVASSGFSGAAGRLYVFFGGGSLDTTQDLIINGEAGVDWLPCDLYEFSKPVDLDNDGYFDIIAGARGNDDYGTDAGKGYIYFGSSSLSGTKAADEADITFAGNTTTKKYLGRASTVGDFNGDGYEDIALAAEQSTAAGAVYIYFGNGTKSFDTSADVTLTVSGSSKLGYDSIVSGDVNGDGYDDLLVGENYATKSKVYLFYGGANMDATNDVVFVGEASTDFLTFGASDVKDLDNDGYMDICLGASKNDAVAIDAGRVYCFFGSSSFSGTKNVGTDAVLIFNGAAASDRFGRELSLYDVNNDGNRDLIVGAYQSGGSGNGYVKVYLGNGTKNFDTTADVTINAADIGESAMQFGAAVLGGDLDNDGWPDLFATSIKGGNGTGSTGRVYIFEVNHGTPTFSLNSPYYTSNSTPTLAGTATDTVNLAGVQWSTTNSASGTWTNCTASDGSFNSLSEGFNCPMISALSEGSNRTVYFRTYDTNSAYMPATSYRSLTYVYDTIGPSASWTSSDGGGRTFSPVQADNLYTTLNLPPFSFTKSKDTNAGIQKYQILIKPEAKEYYTYIDDIPHDNVSGIVLDETTRYARYTNDDILVHSKKTTDQLANGGYKWKVRVLDKAGNATDTEEKILLINTHQANFSKTWFPLVLLSTKPSFYGITTVDSKVSLILKQDNKTILEKQTTANPESRFGINLTKSDNLKPGTYSVLLSATNQQGDYIELPEFKFTYGKKTLPTVAGAKTSLPTFTPTPVVIEPTSQPTPTFIPVPSRPKRCFLFWCW